MTSNFSQGTNYTQDAFSSKTCDMAEMIRVSTSVGANEGTGLGKPDVSDGKKY